MMSTIQHGADPLIFIHGMGLNKSMWDGFVPALAAAGYEVLTYDLLGHGGEKPAVGEVNLTLFSEQLLALMDTRGLRRAHLIGFSIGGMINRRFALDHRERVASLVIWNSPHNRGQEAQAEVEARALAVRGEGPMATIEAALERWFVAASQELRQQIRDWRKVCDSRTYAGTAWTLANGVVELTGAKQPRGIPTQVLTCENDVGSTPAMARDIAHDLGASAPLVIPDLKHLGLLERPEPFLQALLGFLNDRQSEIAPK